MFDEQKREPSAKAPALSSPLIAGAQSSISTLQRQAETLAGQQLTAHTLRATAVQRQQVEPVFQAMSLQREVVDTLSLQRQVMQRQAEQLQASVGAGSISGALQRQATRQVPVAPLGQAPSRPSEWVQVAQLEVQRVADPANPGQTRWLGGAERDRHLGTLRGVGQALVQGFRQDRGSALQRYAEYGEALATLQRQALTSGIVTTVVQQISPTERLSLQRAINEAGQRQADLEEHDSSALQLHGLQRQLAELDQEAADALRKRIQAKSGSGRPLPRAVQRHLEQGLNYDLGKVRIHDDAEADRLAKSVQAIAFTTGTDIFFQSGHFNPNTQSGLELLAHEVTHTVQQSRGPVGKGIDPDAGLEQEAQAMGQRLARLSPMPQTPRRSTFQTLRATGAGVMQRQEAGQRPAPLKDNEQTWTRHYTGQAKGVLFRLTVRRDPGGHLHARYKVTPGHRQGWHLEGQIRKDNSFVLHGHNGATFVGRFLPGGEGLTAAFHRGTAFTVDQLHLNRNGTQHPEGSEAPPKAAPPRSAAPLVSRPAQTQQPRPTPSAAPPIVRPTAPPATSVPEHPKAPQAAEQLSGGTAPTDQPWVAQHTGMKGFDQHPEVQAAILWGAKQLQVNPNDLAATIGYETSGSFKPAVENEAARRRGKQGAVGLIQFTPSVGIPSLNEFLQTKAGKQRAKALGISATTVTRADLLKMTPMEQMRYVVLYFNIPLNAVPAGATYDRIYQEILAPGRDGDVWYSKGTDNYEKNKQFDTNKDGKITRFEAASVLRERGMVVNYFVPGQPTPDVPQPAAVKRLGRTTAASAPSPQLPAPPRQTTVPGGATAQPARQPVQVAAPAQVNPQMDPQSSFDDRVTQALTSFTQAYRFPVSLRWQEGTQTKEKTVEVQTPYYINAGGIQRTVQAHRVAMSAADRSIFQEMPSVVRLGKASPEEMRAAAQLIAQRNPFGISPDKITGAMLTDWLKKYGLGVDCSGFVSQALDYATTQVGGHDPHIGDRDVRVNRASGSLHGNNEEFQKVASPGEVKPGDTMWLSGHIRVVLQVGPGPGGKGIQMMIAESTPNTQLPEARAHGVKDLLGVDRSIWWFADSSKFTRAGLRKKTESYNWDALPNDKWETPNTVSIEALYFSRYRPLARSKKP